MTRVISIMNAKGGTGKTTTAVNLGSYLAASGQRVLLIDFDPQFNATVGLGVKHGDEETIYHALLGGQPLAKVVKGTTLRNLEMIPASADLSGALIELVNLPDRERYLRNFLDQIKHRYDFVFIDFGPSLNLLTINGLLASDEVLIPIQCDYYSLEGLSQILKVIDLIQKNMGHPLKVAGALLTMYDKREKLSREVAREVRRRFPYHVYDIDIPKAVALAEAPSFQKPIILYAPQSPGALAYERLAQELIGQGVPIFQKTIADLSAAGQELPIIDFSQRNPLAEEEKWESDKMAEAPVFATIKSETIEEKIADEVAEIAGEIEEAAAETDPEVLIVADEEEFYKNFYV